MLENKLLNIKTSERNANCTNAHLVSLSAWLGNRWIQNLPIAEKPNCNNYFVTITSKNKKYINAETFRNPQMLIETNLKNALIKIFEKRKALPTFLYYRLPNGPALSCSDEYFQFALNEMSSRWFFPIPLELYAQCKLLQRSFCQLERLVRGHA